MENFINLVSEVWNRGFLVLIALYQFPINHSCSFLLRGFIISVVINTLNKLAEIQRLKLMMKY